MSVTLSMAEYAGVGGAQHADAAQEVGEDAQHAAQEVGVMDGIHVDVIPDGDMLYGRGRREPRYGVYATIPGEQGTITE